MSEDTNDLYIFWIYGWSDNPRLMDSNLFKCEINSKSLKVYSDPALEIPIEEIQGCSQVNVGSSYNMRPFVKITLEKSLAIYLVPANPIRPADAVYSANGEVFDMITVINGFSKNKMLSLDKNPYVRSFRRQVPNRPVDTEAWNPNTAPWEYFPKTGKGVTISRLIISIGAGFLFVILLLLLFLALLGQVHFYVR